ncbi:MAG: triose-phosphate isomerase [Candidatus Kapabacteria bacterium]|nr:triose-phosphate isomerase [Candidatus Kapabacteria bacterium]
MTKTMIVGNWKMNGTQPVARSLAEGLVNNDIIRSAHADGVQVVCCPPFTALSLVQQTIADTPIQLGGQACHHQRQGAHTGDVSAAMLRDVGCSHVLVGHSERRRDHHESDDQVVAISIAAIDAGLVPIICVGETLEEHQQGLTRNVLQRQVGILCSALGNNLSRCVLAYEPVWAIGTGLAATAEHVETTHAYIAEVTRTHGIVIPVLYGGSANASNAEELLSSEHVNGLLVGGASLDAISFAGIVAAARRKGGASS